MGYSLPVALYSALGHLYCMLASLNFPPTVTQTEAVTHPRFLAFHIAFHITTLSLTVQIKLNKKYSSSYQGNFSSLLQQCNWIPQFPLKHSFLHSVILLIKQKPHHRWSPHLLLKDSRCGSCTLGSGRCILLSFHNGKIPHMPNLAWWLGVLHISNHTTITQYYNHTSSIS